MSKSSWWWLATVALAVVTGVAVRVPLVDVAQRSAAYGPLVVVPVVARPVAAGGVVPVDGVRFEERPSSTLPDGEVFTGPAAAGLAAIVALVPGEVLLASKLAPRGLRGAAALLPPGARALVVPGGPFSVGDRVDVLATFDADDRTDVVTRRALVIATDRAAATVTIAVPLVDAPAVASALTTATLTLALTSP